MRIRAMQAYGVDNLIKHRNPYNAIETFQGNVSIPLENTRKPNVFLMFVGIEIEHCIEMS